MGNSLPAKRPIQILRERSVAKSAESAAEELVPESAQLAYKVVKIHEEQSPDSVVLAKAYTTLGESYLSGGYLVEALEIFLKSLIVDLFDRTSNVRCVPSETMIADCPYIAIGENDNNHLQLGPVIDTILPSVVNIGPNTQTGTVVINGFVTFPLMNNFFGYSNGFFNQFA